jgi:hypothetical protein
VSGPEGTHQRRMLDTGLLSLDSSPRAQLWGPRPVGNPEGGFGPCGVVPVSFPGFPGMRLIVDEQGHRDRLTPKCAVVSA